MNREWRNTRRALVVLGTVGLIGVLGLFGWRQAAKAHYARVRAELEAKGNQLTIEAQLPVVDPALSNGGQILRDHLGGIPRPPVYMGFACMELIAPGRALVASGVDEIPYETETKIWTNLWDVLPAHVEPGRGAWSLLRDAATNDVIAFDLPYQEHVRMRLTHLSEQRALYSWLRLAVLQDLREGNHQDAAEAVINGVELIARHREPVIISQLIRVTQFGIHVEAIWELLQSSAASDGDLERLQRALERLDFANAWGETLQMEGAMVLRFFDETIEAGSGAITSGKTSETAISKLIVSLRDGLLAGNWGGIHQAGTEFAWWIGPAWHDATFFAGEITLWREDMLAATRARSAAAATYVHAKTPEWYLMSKSWMAANSLQQRVFTAESIRSLALAAVALERYRRLSRSWPETLDALKSDIVQEVPVDWLDGSPLRYRREKDGGFWLWSIGANGIDDGGKPADAEVDWVKGDDLVWPQRADAATVEAYLGRQRAKAATSK